MVRRKAVLERYAALRCLWQEIGVAETAARHAVGRTDCSLNVQGFRLWTCGRSFATWAFRRETTSDPENGSGPAGRLALKRAVITSNIRGRYDDSTTHASKAWSFSQFRASTKQDFGGLPSFVK
eukprot:1091653-Prymnesium_polylepis.1